MTALRAFARDIELPSPPRDKDGLVNAINEHLPKWHESAETELSGIDAKIRAERDAAFEAERARARTSRDQGADPQPVRAQDHHQEEPG
jgi:hypothetical protein